MTKKYDSLQGREINLIMSSQTITTELNLFCKNREYLLSLHAAAAGENILQKMAAKKA